MGANDGGAGGAAGCGCGGGGGGVYDWPCENGEEPCENGDEPAENGLDADPPVPDPAAPHLAHACAPAGTSAPHFQQMVATMNLLVVRWCRKFGFRRSFPVWSNIPWNDRRRYRNNFGEANRLPSTAGIVPAGEWTFHPLAMTAPAAHRIAKDRISGWAARL